MDETTRQAVAKLGLILGQAKRRGLSYVPVPIPEAQAVHAWLKAAKLKEYNSDYRKL